MRVSNYTDQYRHYALEKNYLVETRIVAKFTPYIQRNFDPNMSRRVGHATTQA